MPFIWPPIMSVGSSRQVTAPSLADVTAADGPATEPQMTTTSHLSSVSSPAEAAAPTHRQQHEQQPPLLHWHTLTSSQTSLSAADLDLGPRWAFYGGGPGPRSSMSVCCTNGRPTEDPARMPSHVAMSHEPYVVRTAYVYDTAWVSH